MFLLVRQREWVSSPRANTWVYSYLNLKPVLNKYPPVKTGGIAFSGKSLKVTGDAQVRFRLACQPCICYLLLVNGLKRECLLLWEKVARAKRVTDEELVKALIIMNTSSTINGSRCDSVTFRSCIINAIHFRNAASLPFSHWRRLFFTSFSSSVNLF